MLDQLFCFRIAAFSVVGYCMAIAGPIYLDCELTSHIRYPARKQPDQKTRRLWWALSPLAFVLPYFGTRLSTSKEMLVFAAVTPLLVLTALAAFSFPPERPHSAVLFCIVGFIAAILLTVVFRIGADDFSYVSDAHIPFESRLERVKATVALWQMICVYGAAGYMAFAVTWVYAMWFTTDKRVSERKDMFTLGQAQLAFALALSLCVLFGPLQEAVSNSLHAMSQLTNVR